MQTEEEIQPFQIWDHVNAGPDVSVRVLGVYDHLDNRQKHVLVESREGVQTLISPISLQTWYRLNDALYRPSSPAYLMGLAKKASEKATCSRAHVGAVAVINGRVLATGYNGSPEKAEHCRHREHLKAGTVDPDLWEVNGRSSCRRAIHAEANLYSYSARFGVALEGCTVYTTTYPCVPCMNQMAAAGVREIVYGADYVNDPYVEQIARDSAVTIRRFERGW